MIKIAITIHERLGAKPILIFEKYMAMKGGEKLTIDINKDNFVEIMQPINLCLLVDTDETTKEERYVGMVLERLEGTCCYKIKFKINDEWDGVYIYDEKEGKCRIVNPYMSTATFKSQRMLSVITDKRKKLILKKLNGENFKEKMELQIVIHHI